MADGDNTPPADPNAAQPPAGGAGAPAGGTPANQDKTEAVALAEKLGKLEAENQALKDYQARVDPVMETLWSDKELFDKATEIHNKRLGITPNSDPKKDDLATPPPPSKIEKDNRNALITQAVGQFNESKGFSKLTPEQQQDFNQRVGMELKEMLDPMGNKTLAQVMEDVSVTKLPQFLEKAHYLAFKNETIAQAREQAKKETQDNNLGMIGSMASTSVDPEQITLTLKEKETCKKAGWDEAKYLENKKALAKKGNQLF